MTKQAAMRASDTDREQVAERLRHAAAEGRLFTDELEDRLGDALSARTYGDLDAVTADLPTTEVPHRSHSVALARLGPLVAGLLALSIAVTLVAAVALGAAGHSHPDHPWIALRALAPVIWLVLLAVGWPFIAHRRNVRR